MSLLQKPWPETPARRTRWGKEIVTIRIDKDTWTIELRPIIDKQIGRWYFTVNPALGRSFHGPSVPEGVGLSPSAKFSYDFNKYISAYARSSEARIYWAG